MKLNFKDIISKKILLSEDWKEDFLLGRKGLPKTDADTLNYIESILLSLYDNDAEKVDKSKIKIWLAKIIKSLNGIENIDSQSLSKIKIVLSWFKLFANYDKVKDMDLLSAFKFADEALKKSKNKEAEGENKSNLKSLPPLPDELDGKITRIKELNDGSNRMWVRVNKQSWFKETCKDSSVKGIMCQATSSTEYAVYPYESFTLIGPAKGSPEGNIKSIASMSLKLDQTAIAEVRQEQNQVPGSQSTSGRWSDVGDLVVDLLCSNDYMKQHAKVFTDASGRMTEGGVYGAKRVFNWWLENRPDLINKLAAKRWDIIENNKKDIINHPNFGMKWFATRNVDVSELATKKPMELISNIEMYVNFFGKQLKEGFAKINFDEIINEKTAPIIYDNLHYFIQLLNEKQLSTALDYIDKIKFQLGIDSFKNIVRKLSVINKKVLNEFVKNKSNFIIKEFGNGVYGIEKFLSFASQPKLDQHQTFTPIDNRNYIIKKTEEFEVDGVTREKTVTFQITDDLKILTQKERKDFIIQNEAYIKKFFKGDEINPDIEFLRVLFSDTNVQDIDRNLRAKKEEFINYYDQKNKTNPAKFKYPGIVQFYITIYKNNTSKVRTDGKKQYFIMDQEDVFNPKVINSLISYYYNNTTNENKNIKIYSSISDYLETAEMSGADKTKLLDLLHNKFEPKKLSNNVELGLIESYILTVEKHFGKSEAKKALINMTEDIKKQQFGADKFKDLFNKLSIKKYEISFGDNVEFVPNKELAATYNLYPQKTYHILRTIDGKDGTINEFVVVTNEKKEDQVVPSKYFNVSSKFIFENLSPYLNLRNNIKNVLMDNNNLSEQRGRKVSYSAIVLDSDSKRTLLNFLREFEQDKDLDLSRWAISSDHVTINLGNIYDKNLLGEVAVVSAKAIGFNDRTIAISVDVDLPIKFKNKIPHITLAFNAEAGAKPMESNYLTNWTPLERSIELFGEIKEIYHV